MVRLFFNIQQDDGYIQDEEATNTLIRRGPRGSSGGGKGNSRRWGALFPILGQERFATLSRQRPRHEPTISRLYTLLKAGSNLNGVTNVYYSPARHPQPRRMGMLGR